MQRFTPTIKQSDNGLLALSCVLIVLFFVVIAAVSDNSEDEYPIQNVEYFVDGNNQLALDDIRSLPETSWQATANPVNLGMYNVNHWFRLELPAQAQGSEARLFQVDYSLLDHLDVWVFAHNKAQPVVSQQFGDGYPFSDRPINHESFVVSLPYLDEPATVIMRVNTSGSIKLPIHVWNKVEFAEFVSQRNLIIGVFFGFLLAMGSSNLFFFFTTRSESFLVYAGYVFSLALTLASLHGIGYKYLWPEQVWFQGRAVAVFANATTLFAVIFSYWLLNVREHSERFASLLRIICWLFLASMGISLVVPYAIVIKVFLAGLAVVAAIAIGLGIWLTIKGVVIARFYSLAWTILLASGVSASLDNLNIVTMPIPSQYLLMFGASIESMLLALVLAISYSRQRMEMLDAKEEALAQERAAVAAQNELIQVQQQTQEDLEYKVQERTLELEITLRELSEVNRELENLNTIDALTGVRNRRHFDKRLLAESRRSRREQTPLSLAMIDIDHFKQLNDQHGHAVGDECIKHIAKLMQQQLKRPTDDLCRYGGEEFAIILPNTDLDGAQGVIEAIRQTIEQTPLQYEELTLSMTVSCGVACATIQQEQQELTLLKRADELLYDAKRQGRNRTCTGLQTQP